MAGPSTPDTFPMPTILPLGDSGLLVRFGTTLTDPSNRAATAFALTLEREPISGVVEVVPNLVSVLLRYDPLTTAPAGIAGEVGLRLNGLAGEQTNRTEWVIPTAFDGPDLDEVAASLSVSPAAFVAAHNASALRVLATGFAPGFVYCGLHPDRLLVPRRSSVRSLVPAGSVLFAAGQTAIAATEMPTGWHVIGRTGFINFDPVRNPPTRLNAGDSITFEVAS